VGLLVELVPGWGLVLAVVLGWGLVLATGRELVSVEGVAASSLEQAPVQHS